jgi:lipoprotein-anchoring transpeptidase ErfK/SrfK
MEISMEGVALHAITRHANERHIQCASAVKHSLYLIAIALVLTLPASDGLRAQITAPTPAIVSDAAALDKLPSLGYWCDTTNRLTAANKQAIVAFQKLSRLKRSATLDRATLAALDKAQVPVCAYSIGLRHYEVSLDHQVLLIVAASNIVERVLPVSTGNGKWFETPKGGGRYARTPRGKFNVFYKVAGWRTSELGKLYYPLYVRGGVAIHGAPSVPSTPASHGCIRIPMFAARQLFNLTPIGTVVIVYGENPPPTK